MHTAPCNAQMCFILLHKCRFQDASVMGIFDNHRANRQDLSWGGINVVKIIWL